LSKRWRFSAIELAIELAVFNALEERYEIVRDMPLPGRYWRLGISAAY
jgi:hypothetical protein